MDSVLDPKAETRTRILEAAGKRFMHYGYAKTTMAEIARDLNMSTGNLYRFFESKVDIAEGIAREHEAAEDEVMRVIAAQDAPAEERLRTLMFTLMRETYKVMDESQKVYDIAQAISRERPSYANRRLAQERVFLGRILADGMSEGAFDKALNVEFVAEMIQCATMKFRYPQLYSFLKLPALERELGGVLDLVLDGMRAR
jgi:AcrR family transcriptional regulator